MRHTSHLSRGTCKAEGCLLVIISGSPAAKFSWVFLSSFWVVSVAADGAALLAQPALSFTPARHRSCVRGWVLQALALPGDRSPGLPRSPAPRPTVSPRPAGCKPAPAQGRAAAAGLGKACRSEERPCAVSQGTPPSCGLPTRGDAKGLSWVATSSKANKLESKPRNTSTSWNSASCPHSCPSLLNTCKAELIRTDSIAFVSLLGTRGGSRGGDALGSAEGPPYPACSLGRISGS